jgi:uncharacterized LabA/DUF88 family protein
VSIISAPRGGHATPRIVSEDIEDLIVDAVSKPSTRIRVFVDYWNFQLRLNELEARERGVADHRFHIDWKELGLRLGELAAQAARVDAWTFEGAHIYTSFNPKTEANFKNWATTWLARQPGIKVECRERRGAHPPKCPTCYVAVETCPTCKGSMRGTVEKGVDTLIATDMIRLAWEDTYDLAVLATSDADLVPAAEFLGAKGKKVIQAGFPPYGIHLATACWASVDVFPVRMSFQRR